MSEKRKIGEGHAAAMGRLGHKELTHNILPAFPHQGQHIIEEPGLVGNPTQGEVADARDGPGKGSNQESRTEEKPQQKKYSLEELRGMAKDHAKKAEHEMEHGKGNEHGKDQDHER